MTMRDIRIAFGIPFFDFVRKASAVDTVALSVGEGNEVKDASI